MPFMQYNYMKEKYKVILMRPEYKHSFAQILSEFGIEDL